MFRYPISFRYIEDDICGNKDTPKSLMTSDIAVSSRALIHFLITRSSIKAELQLCCAGSLLCSLTPALHFITNSAVAFPSISVMLMQCETGSKHRKEKKEFLICIYCEQWMSLWQQSSEGEKKKHTINKKKSFASEEPNSKTKAQQALCFHVSSLLPFRGSQLQ